MEKVFESLLPVLLNIALAVGALALGAIAVWVKQYVQVKVGHEKLDLILKKAEVLVHWAEQTMGKMEGFEKKEIVMIGLKALSQAIDYFLDDAELDQIIEAEVFKMNGDKWPEPQAA